MSLPALAVCFALATAPSGAAPRPLLTRAEVLGGVGSAVALAGATLFGVGHSLQQNYRAERAPSLLVGGAALIGFGVVLIALSVLQWTWEGNSLMPPAWVLW